MRAAENGVAELLTEKQVAKALGVSVAGLRGWRHKGRGPRWFRLDERRRTRYDPAAVRAWIIARAEAASVEKPKMGTTRAETIALLDELAGYGVIEYNLHKQSPVGPLLEIWRGPRFDEGLPQTATPLARIVFDDFRAGRLRAAWTKGGHQ